MRRRMPTAFASADELDAAALSAAPVHWPRPSRLDEPVTWKPRPAAEAADASGLTTVGALLDHLPRDSGEARTIAELVPDETATVIVEVRSISSRPVRRRGMKPLVEAVVSDATGVMKATFFNQPWLKDQYKAGTPAHAGRQVPGRQSLPRQQPRAHRRGGRRRRRPPRSTPPPRASPRRRSSPPCASTAPPSPTWSSRCPPRCGSPSACPIARRRSPRRTSATARRGRARLAFDELLVDQVVQLRLRAERRATQAGMALTEEPDALARVARHAAALHAHRRPGHRDGRDRRRPRRRAPDAAPAHGRGRLGQDGRGPARHAARGRARHAGGHDGAHRDAGRAALRHAAGAHARLAGARRAADRLDAGRAARRPAGQAAHRRAEAHRRHPRADRGGRRVRAPGRRRGRRAAPLRRAPARRAGRQGAGGARAPRPAHDGDADPAHAAPGRLRRARRHHAARAAQGPPADRDASSSAASASATAPTSASARSCAPATRPSSSARW